MTVVSLSKHGVKQSFSAMVRSHDNAVADAFFASFQKEEAYRREYASEQSYYRISKSKDISTGRRSYWNLQQIRQQANNYGSRTGEEQYCLSKAACVAASWSGSIRAFGDSWNSCSFNTMRCFLDNSTIFTISAELCERITSRHYILIKVIHVLDVRFIAD